MLDDGAADETIQELAHKLMLEQNANEKILNGPTERTVFVLGSKGVVSSWPQSDFQQF